MKDIHIDFYRAEKDYWWAVTRRQEALYAWRRFSEPGLESKILDVGCGAGLLLSILSQDAKAYGVDVSIKACEFSKSKKINVLQADACCLPLRDNYFNAVFALDLIEHIEDELTVLKQIYRVCVQGGICILTAPAWNCLWGQRDKWLGHKRRYTVGGLSEIVEQAGFKIIRCNYIHICLFPILYFANKIKQFLRYNRIKTDVASVPRLLNLFLIYLFSVEAKLSSRINFPLGTSVICILKKC